MNKRQRKKRVTPAPDAANKNRILSIICIFLVVATLTAYWQVLDHGFSNYDDGDYVTKNLKVQSGLTSESFVWAFTTSHFNNWHPLTWLSHILDYQFYGPNPQGHHLTNLVFHVANTLLLFLILNHITGAVWKSGFVAALFALHPFNVESVAWIAERKNVLSTFFWLLTMWAYLQYTEKSGIKRYILMTLLFALGLMAKPMLVTLPFVLLMMDYWPLKRLKQNNNLRAGEKTDQKFDFAYLVREKIPLFLMVVVSSIATFLTQKSDVAMKPEEPFPLFIRLVNAAVSYLEYLGKTFWPLKLAVFYPHPGDALPAWKGILCGMALVGISVLSLKLIKKAPYLAFGWFWYLGTLVPVIGIVQAFRWWHGMADRYMYIPLIGIFIVVAWGLPELLANWRYKKKVLSIAAVIIVPALMMITWKQVGHWKDDVTLFRHALIVADKEYPRIALAYYNLGVALGEQEKFHEAVSHYKEAIKLMPTYAEAHFNLGISLSNLGELEEAIPHFRETIQLEPGFARAHNNLGNALTTTQKTDEAITHYQEAIRLMPDYAQAHNNLGISLEERGDIESAIPHFKTATLTQPDFFHAFFNLGNALFKKGQLEEAINNYKMAIKIKPDFVSAHNNLGNALAQKGNLKEAMTHYKEVIRMRPDFPPAQISLEKVRLQLKERGGF